MTMAPGLRKLVLAVHLTFSVGWIGAVVAYLALVFAAMGSQEAQTVRAAWIGMELTIRYVIVPLALLSLLTGLVMALGTKWGLFRHYWVLISLVLTVFATTILLQHIPTVRLFAGLAVEMDSVDVSGLPGELPHAGTDGGRQSQSQGVNQADGLGGELFHAGGGLLVLLVVQVLNVYKPRGLTRYGWRKEQEERRERHEQPTASRAADTAT